MVEDCGLVLELDGCGLLFLAGSSLMIFFSFWSAFRRAFFFGAGPLSSSDEIVTTFEDEVSAGIFRLVRVDLGLLVGSGPGESSKKAPLSEKHQSNQSDTK